MHYRDFLLLIRVDMFPEPEVAFISKSCDTPRQCLPDRNSNTNVQREVMFETSPKLLIVKTVY